MHSFPQHLLDGYAAFMAGRYAARPSAIQEAGRGRPVAHHHGHRLLRQPRGARNDLRCRPGRTVRPAQCRQPGADLPARRRPARHLGRHRIRRQRARQSRISWCWATAAAAASAPRSTRAMPLAQGDFIGKWMSMLAPVTEQVATYSFLTADRTRDRARAPVGPQLDQEPPHLPLYQGSARPRAAHGAWRLVRYLDRRTLGDGSRDRRLSCRPELPELVSVEAYSSPSALACGGNEIAGRRR